MTAAPVVHFEVVGTDAGKTRDFYGKIFGWKFDVMPEQDYGVVDNGGNGINGGVAGYAGEKPHAIFYAAVPDPQATLDQIEKLGGKVVTPVTEIPNVVTFAIFSDPDGNVVGIIKDTPPA